MTVSLVSAGTVDIGGGTTRSVSVDAGAAADRILYALITLTGASLNWVQYAGAGMTDVGSSGPFRIFRISPASGVNNLTINLSSNYSASMISFFAMSGVDQTSPGEAPAYNAGSSGFPVSGSATMAPNGLVIGSGYSNYTFSLSWAGSGATTMRGSAREGGGGSSIAGGTRASSGALGWTVANSAWQAIAIAINPVAAAAVSAPPRRRASNLLLL